MSDESSRVKRDPVEPSTLHEFALMMKVIELLDAYGVNPMYLEHVDLFREGNKYGVGIDYDERTPPEQQERVERLHADFGVKGKDKHDLSQGDIIADSDTALYNRLQEGIDNAPRQQRSPIDFV